MKIILGALSLAVFCFSAGIYVNNRLSTVTDEGRDIASLKRSQVTDRKPADTKLANALKACVEEQISDRKIRLNKALVDGRRWAILSLNCVGDNARNLYNAVGPYADEQYVRYSDQRRAVGRFFGRLYPPSQCVRILGGPNASELNLFSCSIRIDLDHELINDLRL
jgi:hypothetical protein